MDTQKYIAFARDWCDGNRQHWTIGPIMQDLQSYKPNSLARVIAQAISERDAEWTRSLGITDNVLTPEECAKWLQADRAARARNVASESSPRFREVKHY